MSKRKMLAAEEDLANKVAELAEKRGLTVYQTVNDILEQAIRAEEQGLNLKEVVDRRGDMERAREMVHASEGRRAIYIYNWLGLKRYSVV